MPKSLKFYLASSFELAQKTQDVSDFLEASGHFVPVKWWNLKGEAHASKTSPMSDQEFYTSKAVLDTADRDFKGVISCDVLIIITDEPSRKFNGAAIETGFAIAHGKPCYALGRLDRSAMFAPIRHGMTLEEILVEVEKLA